MKLQGPAALVLASLTVISGYSSTSVRNVSPLANEMGSAPGESVKQHSSCPSGQYKPEHSEECCTRCKAGTHLLEDCTRGEETKCGPCSDNEFMDGENHSRNCRRCRQCQEGSGEETKTKCNKTHDTVCMCRKNFFCLTSGNCLQCRLCKECDVKTQEIAQPCTERNDTVCVEKDIKSSNTSVVIGVVILAVILAGVVGGILYFKRHLLPCNKKPRDFQLVPLNPADARREHLTLSRISVHYSGTRQSRRRERLENSAHCVSRLSIDIKYKVLYTVKNNQCTFSWFRFGSSLGYIVLSAEDLSLIVAEIEPKKFHDLGLRLGLGEPKLQQIEADYYNDKSRQGYEILSSWLQGHGKKGAFPLLIATLNKAKCVSAAENIIQKISPPAEDTTERSKLDASENGTTMDSVPV